MKLLWLKEIIGDAYTEDMDAAACQAIGKDFVAVRTSTPKTPVSRSWRPRWASLRRPPRDTPSSLMS